MNLASVLIGSLTLAGMMQDGARPPSAPGKSLPQPVSPASLIKPEVSPGPEAERASELILRFAYGSEKKGWIDEVTQIYNSERHSVPGGGDTRLIRVEPIAMGSGEIIERLLKPTGDPNKLVAHLVSPASGAFVTIGKGQSREATGKELISDVQELVQSPLVLAMWSELAEASGWRAKAPSWREVFGVTGDAKRWSLVTKERPGIPAFRLGHADPERSNSGLLTMILIVESAAPAPKAFEGALTRTVVRSSEVVDYVRKVESGVVQPLSASTGFLADAMLTGGPSGMGAAIVYESLVIEKNRSGGAPKLVAIYPTEGVFANEHPIGIIQSDEVTADHKEAARDYIRYLRAKPQQEKAKLHGFRPVDPSIPIDDLVKPGYGVTSGDWRRLTYPNSQLLRDMLAVWRIAVSPPAATSGGRP